MIQKNKTYLRILRLKVDGYSIGYSLFANLLGELVLHPPHLAQS